MISIYRQPQYSHSIPHGAIIQLWIVTKQSMNQAQIAETQQQEHRSIESVVHRVNGSPENGYSMTGGEIKSQAERSSFETDVTSEKTNTKKRERV